MNCLPSCPVHHALIAGLVCLQGQFCHLWGEYNRQFPFYKYAGRRILETAPYLGLPICSDYAIFKH